MPSAKDRPARTQTASRSPPCGEIKAVDARDAPQHLGACLAAASGAERQALSRGRNDGSGLTAAALVAMMGPPRQSLARPHRRPRAMIGAAPEVDRPWRWPSS